MNTRIAASLGLALAACSAHADNPEIRLQSAGVQKAIPSGSGMSRHAGKHFVVGDDSPYLFTLDRNFEITDRSLLKAYPVEADGRIAKEVKPDYEAMATVTWGGSHNL